MNGAVQPSPRWMEQFACEECKDATAVLYADTWGNWSHKESLARELRRVCADCMRELIGMQDVYDAVTARPPWAWLHGQPVARQLTMPDQLDAYLVELAAEIDAMRSRQIWIDAHDSALRAWGLSVTPADPLGGHRPLVVADVGVVCLDCPGTSVESFFGGDFVDWAIWHRRQRFPGRGVPWSLCQWEKWPAFGYYPEPPRAMTPPDLGTRWPAAADSYPTYELDGVPLMVCHECRKGLRRMGREYRVRGPRE